MRAMAPKPCLPRRGTEFKSFLTCTGSANQPCSPRDAVTQLACWCRTTSTSRRSRPVVRSWKCRRTRRTRCTSRRGVDSARARSGGERCRGRPLGCDGWWCWRQHDQASAITRGVTAPSSADNGSEVRLFPSSRSTRRTAPVRDRWWFRSRHRTRRSEPGVVSRRVGRLAVRVPNSSSAFKTASEQMTK
jgi:hypothetical protein